MRSSTPHPVVIRQHLLLTLLLLGNVFHLFSQTLPSGFTSVQVVSGLLKPAAMTFAPDGRIFIAEQDGFVRVVKNGTLLSTPMIKLKVNLRGEGGLIGIAVDPNFSTNQFLYLYYTLQGGSRNRISRFKCEGDVAPLSSEHVVLNLDTLIATIHNGGAMHFKDGKLFVAIGENSNELNAQNLDTYHGKVIRINTDGSVPAGNPYTSGSVQRRSVWAYGLRNPFTFAIQPGTGKIFVNDVGFNAWEEVNDATQPGRNFGWPEAEGNSSNPAFTNAVYTYEHGRNDLYGCAITGGTFFNPSQTNYPASYTGKYFFQDYCGQWIKMFNPSASPVVVENFASGIGEDALYITTGNDGNLYYLVRSTGALYRITYSANQAPAILRHPSSVSVSSGEPASFSVTASGQAPLSYQWMKDGANITGATSATYTISQANSGHAGSYRVRVSNAAGNVLSNSAQLTVTAFNNKPVAQIITPASGAMYRAGNVIAFSGSATDTEDGELPASRFTWFADFHHDTHHHDSPAVATGSKSGSFTIPVRGETSDNVWYRLILIVTDSQGAKDTVFRDIHPHKSTITLVTQPAGLKVKLDGASVNSPLSFLSVENLERTLGAVSPQLYNGDNYIFDRWLHGGSETQVVSTPLNDVTYTAVYKKSAAANTIQREVWSNVSGTDVSAIPLSTSPSAISDLSDFEGPANTGSNYGARVRGYVQAPATGNYIFWIASDDKSELWLSTDENPGNKRKIAIVGGHTTARQWNKYPTQQSAPINLISGRRYYIEALHKEATGTDHLAVGWQLPGGVFERPIPAMRLSRFTGQSTPVINISSPVNGQVYTAPASISISANASVAGGSIVKVEFYRGSVKLGEDATSPYNFSWNNVASGNYTIRAKATDNGGGSASASVQVIVKGMIQREVWTDITGTAVTSIPLNTSPDAVENLTSLEGPLNAGSNYGSRIRGYIHPPSNGNYIFWIASDDKSELYLSTSANPVNKVKIASVTGYTRSREWNKYTTQQSAPVNLVGGQRYYIELLHKEGTGVDHVAVGWQLPNGTMERPVPGSRLSPFEDGGETQVASFDREILIAEESGEDEIVISPNPVPQGKIGFTISGVEFSAVARNEIEMSDVTGRSIGLQVAPCDDICSHIYVAVSESLSPGIYVIKVFSLGKRYQKRLVVN